MKLSVILISDYDEQLNKDTLDLISCQSLGKNEIQLLIADKTENGSDFLSSLLKNGFADLKYKRFSADSKNAEIYDSLKSEISGEVVTFIICGDKFEANYLELAYNKLAQNKKLPLLSVKKFFECSLDRKTEPYSSSMLKSEVVDLKEIFSRLPWFFEGTFIRRNSFLDIKFDLSLSEDAEKDALLRFLSKNTMILCSDDIEYTFVTPRDYEFRFYQGMYLREWYYDSLERFMICLAKDTKDKAGAVPGFIQYFLLFMIYCRMEANSNNRNKHVLSEEEGFDYVNNVSAVLQYIDDEVIFNLSKVTSATSTANVKKLMLEIKYGIDSTKTEIVLSNDVAFAAYNNLIFYSTKQMRVNVLFMNYVDGNIEMDATFPDVFPMDKYEFFIKTENGLIAPIFNERYSLTKYFGCSAFKRRSFHASIPVDKKLKDQKFRFVFKCGDMLYDIYPEYKSHTSRISAELKWGYWALDDKFICYHKNGCINISRASKKTRFYRQMRIFLQLLESNKKRTFLVFLGRLAYWVTKPYFRNKKIWMFYDKIYKGGDSSEYLFKYASKQNDGIRKYYLIDKHVPDYKRLKKEGYKPLIRNSVMHKLVFFNANMMIVSNSTVFAFNDFPLYLSTYIRDIVDFHVVCVQHGLSVQKIAIAQNRLRDNTRLYYCASPYEIKNLSHPVYDYADYDALRLTGVPRYDGLVNNDQRQILLSPTWRMQSAMLVSRNEGVQRDYNDHFKESSYYKVFNSLINDERLLSAAKKYGYRIAYVLHPIVASQADDFDKNDYVDIIPSTGDMSYEKMFCESSLMVTDYSGVQFDFAYMRKPLVYLHHNDIPQHYEEGTYHYDTMAFGEIVHTNDELIDLLVEYMKNDCRMKEVYRKRADDFFAFSDHNNCQRIYDDMIKYQEKNIK